MTALALAKSFAPDGEIKPPFIAHGIACLDDYLAFLERGQSLTVEHIRLENSLIPDDSDGLLLDGWCGVCRRPSQFWVDFQYAFAPRSPNWRERVICQTCILNNRTRGALHYTDNLLEGVGRLYLTEQCTHLADAVFERYPTAIGSEFVRDGTQRGGVNSAGLRFEDVTALTFDDSEFDAILTLDVLEHVPRYRLALGEFARCLRPGGHLIMTVPFDFASASTVTRATVNEDGSINHLLPPEVHGDPLNDEGILAYYNFGWDFLDDVRRAGFADVSAEFYWSLDLGYLGGWQFLIHARK